MNNEDVYNQLLDMFEDLLKATDSKEGDKYKAPVTKELKEQVDELEKFVHEFIRATDHAVLSAGVTQEEIDKYVETPPESASKEQKEILQKAKKLRGHATSRALLYSLAYNLAKAEEERKSGKPGKAAMKRKGKFRGMGGGKGWQKL